MNMVGNFRTRQWFHIFVHRVAPHLIFWAAILLLLTLIGQGRQGFWFTLGYEVVNVIFYALIVYFNLLYLIPNYLTKKVSSLTPYCSYWPVSSLPLCRYWPTT